MIIAWPSGAYAQEPLYFGSNSLLGVWSGSTTYIPPNLKGYVRSSHSVLNVARSSHSIVHVAKASHSKVTDVRTDFN